MDKNFYTVLENRRTIYAISKETPVSDEKIEEIVKKAVKHTPSAFNSQSARIVVLFGQQHNLLWDITKETLRKIVPSNNFAPTEEKINSFYNGYGTVLFFDDTTVTESFMQQFALYKDNFPIWAQQSNGMLQYVIWTSLENEGLGASLQHYGSLIEEDVKKKWGIPNNWKLIAQMPFGKPTAGPGDKEFQPLDQRIKIFK